MKQKVLNLQSCCSVYKPRAAGVYRRKQGKINDNSPKNVF